MSFDHVIVRPITHFQIFTLYTYIQSSGSIENMLNTLNGHILLDVY